MTSLPFNGYDDVKKKEEDTIMISYAEFIDNLKTNYEEHNRVRNLVQHLPNNEANPEWLKSREGRLTGSKVAAVVGFGYNNVLKFKRKHNISGKKISYDQILQLIEWNKGNNYEQRVLQDFLTSTFCGNKYTQWGNDMEDECEKQFMFTHGLDDYELQSFVMNHSGLCIGLEEDSWMGMSPDGIVKETFKDGSVGVHLCEWKCPWPYIKGNPKFTSAENMYGPIQLADGKWYPITLYYYCQIQWGMGLLQDQHILYSKTLPDHCKQCGKYMDSDSYAQHCCTYEDISIHKQLMYCYFGVWAPKDPSEYVLGLNKNNVFQEVTKIPFNETFYEWMKEIAKSFWWNHYLPRRYKQLYPRETIWKGRTLADKDYIFQFVREQMLKKHYNMDRFQLVDWGSGTGSVLLYALETLKLQKVMGFEQDSSLVMEKALPYTIIGDICDSVQNNVSNINNCLDSMKPILHYIYDGGIYPSDLSSRILQSIVSHDIPFHRSVVCVIMSMYSANIEGKQFQAKDWANQLKKKYTYIRTKLDVQETNEEDLEPTMRVHLFISK